MINLQNIFNNGKRIYLFERINDQLRITEDPDFFPYYYEPSDTGTYTAYDGKKVRKIALNNPYDISKLRSNNSYESDIAYTKRYIIDRIDEIGPSKTKYLFIDIEILTKELPDTTKAEYPISCVTIYSNYTKDYNTWFLGEWAENESGMLEDVAHYIKNEQPDCLLAWNIDFDYTYLHHRYLKLFNIEFAKDLSSIGQSRMGKNNSPYPAGISILDYKGLYEKITLNKKRSYALDYIAQEDLGEKSFNDEHLEEGIGNIFKELNPLIKQKNQNDVRRMVDLEAKFKVITHFDAIRRFAKCLWEDLPQEKIVRNGKLETVSNNSKIIDTIILNEAHKMGFILPKKPFQQDKEDFEGAYRENLAVGAFENVGKYDLSGAYLYAIIDYCLDSSNIKEGWHPPTMYDPLKINVTDRETKDVKNTYFVLQNKKALLPTVVEKLVNEKNTYKDLLKATPSDSPDYQQIHQTYLAVKGIVLSSWGVIANQYFRLYDHRVASMITSIVRSLLHYVKTKLVEENFRVLYIDTDSVFVLDQGKNLSDHLNRIVENWSQETFNKPTSITFEYEGTFDKILILRKCHYYGYIKGRKKPEIKGVEIKRSSSSKYEAKFQEELINKVLNKESQEKVSNWVISQLDEIKKLPIKEVSFPAKITNTDYINDPIFVRAWRNSKKLFKGFEANRGDLFYYIFVESLGVDDNGKEIDVIAFNDSIKLPGIVKIDWDNVIRRSIKNKTEVIFEVLGWSGIDVLLKGQTTLF